MYRKTFMNLFCELNQFNSLAKDLGVSDVGDYIYLYGGIPAYLDFNTRTYSFTKTEHCSFDYKRHVLNAYLESIISKYTPKENCGDADELTNALIRLNDEIQARNKELDGQQSLFEEEGEE